MCNILPVRSSYCISLCFKPGTDSCNLQKFLLAGILELLLIFMARAATQPIHILTFTLCRWVSMARPQWG